MSHPDDDHMAGAGDSQPTTPSIATDARAPSHDEASPDSEPVDSPESGQAPRQRDPFSDGTREADTVGQTRLRAFDPTRDGTPTSSSDTSDTSTDETPETVAEWGATGRTAPVDRTRHDGGLSTEVGHGRAGGDARPRVGSEQTERLKRTQQRATTSSRDESLRTALGEVERMADRLEVPDHTTKTATRLVKQVSEESLLLGRSLEAAAGACLHAACQVTHQPTTLGDIVAFSRVDERAIANAFSAYNAALELPLPPRRPEEYLGRITSATELGLQETERRQLRATAQRIIEGLDEIHLSGKPPHTVAAGAVALAGRQLNIGLTDEAVAAAAGTSRQTVHIRRTALTGKAAEPDPSE
jgi:transcription initiation factor TFIIB